MGEQLFHVEPPASDASPEEWAAWMEADKQAAAVEKRQATMRLEHGDENDLWGHVSLGFEGDWDAGEGEIIAVVQPNQEADLRAANMAQRKRGSKRKRLNPKRRRALRRKAMTYRR